MTEGLTAKILELHRRLSAAELAHAFGGALALAFCVSEPRATKDIDVNVFIGPDRVDELRRALPPAVETGDDKIAQLRRDGQARLWWGGTPVDVFLSNHPFHDRAEASVTRVPFAGVEALPVLACADLAVFKAMFARPKDVLDVATMAATGSISLDDLRRTVADLLGTHEERKDFFARAADTVDELRRDQPDG